MITKVSKTQFHDNTLDLSRAIWLVLDGFEKGIFGRNTENDDQADWASRAAPYLAALGMLQQYTDLGDLIREENRRLRAMLSAAAVEYGGLRVTEPGVALYYGTGEKSLGELHVQQDPRSGDYLISARLA